MIPRWLWRAAGQIKTPPPPFPPDDERNLTAACFTCNIERKRDQVAGADLLSDTVAWVFVPRAFAWEEHFGWAEDYTEIVGLSPMGRGTVRLLQWNEPPYPARRRTLRQAYRGGGSPWPA